MAAPATASRMQPLVFEEMSIDPGEVETVRMQKLSDFARQFWQTRSSHPKCRIEITAHFGDGIFKSDWAMQRRNWVSRILIAQHRVPAQSITLIPPIENGVKSGSVVVRMTTAESALEAWQAQFDEMRDGLVNTLSEFPMADNTT